jgi:hypothetical protein
MKATGNKQEQVEDPTKKEIQSRIRQLADQERNSEICYL